MTRSSARTPPDAPSRWLALLVLVPVVVFLACAQVSTAFSGQFTVVRSMTAVDAGDGHAVLVGIGVDLVFVVAWAVTVPWVAKWGLAWLRPFHLTHRRYRLAWVFACAAAGLDLVENGLLALAVELRGSSPDVLLAVLAAVGWSKLAAYVVAGAGVAGIVLHGALGGRVDRVMNGIGARTVDRLNGTPPPAQTTRASGTQQCPTAATGQPVGIGICVSGGGIRAAGIALGALAALDRPRDWRLLVDPTQRERSVFRSARWLCAVSGGAFTAAGWRLSRAPDSGARLSPALDGGAGSYPVRSTSDGLFDLDSLWRQHVLARHRYLDNGFLSLVGGLVGALLRTVLVLGGVAAGAALTGWVAALWVRSLCSAAHDPVRKELWAPGVVLLVGGAALLLLGLARHAPNTWRAAGGYLLAGGAGMVVLLQGLPLVVPQDVPMQARQLVSAFSGFGVVSSLVGLLAPRLARYWLRLGGVLLAVLALLLANWVARHTVDDGAGAVPEVVGVSIALLVLLSLLDSHRLTLAGTYRKRVAATFATRLQPHSDPAPLAYGGERPMADYRARPSPGPRLIVSATAHSSHRTVSGLKGAGITFDDQHIHLYDGSNDGAGSCVPTSNFPAGSAWFGYPRSWSYSRAMALSGAAVASAMGRQALGTTNALLAATNLRLGMWIPNPARTEQDFAAGDASRPRVGLGYLAKELFGRYDLVDDPFVYVADGGHRDNLGLVDLLRRRPREVYVVDASGDRPGTFETLRQAIDLAALELGIRITVDWAPIRHGTQDPTAPGPVMPGKRSSPAVLPRRCATTGEIVYQDGGRAVLRYARNQLAVSSPPSLRAFGGQDPAFPAYSTADQFLSDEQFARLVELGEHMGTSMLAT